MVSFRKILVIVTMQIALIFSSISVANSYPLPFYMKRYVAADGWIISIFMDNFKFKKEEFDLAKPFSKGGLLSLRSAGEVYGKSPFAILGGAVDHGVELACTVDISDGVTVGSQASISPNAQLGGNLGINGDIGAQIPITSGQLTLGFPNGLNVTTPTIGITPSGTISVNGSVSPQVGITATIMPSISTHLKPGARQKISLAKKDLATTAVFIDDQEINVMVDNCLGAVSMRIYTMFKISTKLADTTVYLYSKRINL